MAGGREGRPAPLEMAWLAVVGGAVLARGRTVYTDWCAEMEQAWPGLSRESLRELRDAAEALLGWWASEQALLECLARAEPGEPIHPLDPAARGKLEEQMKARNFERLCVMFERPPSRGLPDRRSPSSPLRGLPPPAQGA